MAKNFEGIKNQRYGVEIECTGLTRSSAAKAVAKVLGGSPEHYGGSYDRYDVKDSKNRTLVFHLHNTCVTQTEHKRCIDETLVWLKGSVSYFAKYFSARPGEKSSHREATVQPGAKISL